MYVTAALLVLGCGAAPESTKYVQTWTTSYGQTSCADWQATMDNHQRFVAAADMLLTLRQKDGDGTIPADDMVGAFALNVSDMCVERVGDAATLSEIGVFVYLAFPEEFHP